MLEVLRVLKGYCLECRQPKLCGELKLIGWSHTFTMCVDCLQSRARLIETMSRGGAPQVPVSPAESPETPAPLPKD